VVRAALGGCCDGDAARSLLWLAAAADTTLRLLFARPPPTSGATIIVRGLVGEEGSGEDCCCSLDCWSADDSTSRSRGRNRKATRSRAARGSSAVGLFSEWRLGGLLLMMDAVPSTRAPLAGVFFFWVVGSTTASDK